MTGLAAKGVAACPAAATIVTSGAVAAKSRCTTGWILGSGIEGNVTSEAVVAEASVAIGYCCTA